MREGKHRVILRLLKSRILRGVYEGRMPGDRGLAAELGVAISTIQLALTQLEAVGLVERRLRSGTFVVTREDRLKSSVPMSVLFSYGSGIQPGVSTDTWASEVIYAFEQEAKSRGLDMVLTRHTLEDTASAVSDALVHLNGLTCAGACMFSQPVNVAHVLRLAEGPGPVVLADWETSDLVLPTVVFDNVEAGRLAAAHLLALGHRRIIFADPLPPSPARLVRAEEAADLTRKTGGTFRYVHGPEFGWGVPECVRLLQAPDRPTAVMCGAGHNAVAMAAAAAQLGLNVPRDVSLIAMGNIRTAQAEKPFTHLCFDHVAMGTKALDLLLEIEPGMSPRKVLIPVRLADFATTAPPPSEPHER